MTANLQCGSVKFTVEDGKIYQNGELVYEASGTVINSIEAGSNFLVADGRVIYISDNASEADHAVAKEKARQSLSRNGNSVVGIGIGRLNGGNVTFTF